MGNANYLAGWVGGRPNQIIFAYIETGKYKVLTKCPCVSFNDSCPGWGLILETEGGTQPEDECVEERLQKVRGWKALEGRARKVEPLNKPPVHPGVNKPPALGSSS